MKKINKNTWEGVKWRSIPEYNYLALWGNLKTIRFDVGGPLMELPPELSEFFDVGITTKCNAGDPDWLLPEDVKSVQNQLSDGCSFCYVSASKLGQNFKDICGTWKRWMDTFPKDKYDKRGNCLTSKSYQCAIGSCGEPTCAPDLSEFLQTVYESGVVPNYTTNGIVLSYYDSPDSAKRDLALKILEATAKYCGGVAVSFGNKALRRYAEKAVEGLFRLGDCHVMIHHIISDRQSVDDFVECWKKYGDKIRNHVLLPLMPAGRSKSGVEDGVFEYLEEVINGKGIQNVAFGAHFIDRLKDSSIKTWLYPAETYSKNILLKDGKVVITRSSFDLKPIKIIEV